jgi:leucine dehydrogenase
METADMDIVRCYLCYWNFRGRGGAGNPSPVTAYGVYVGMKAAAKQQFGSDVLSGKKY